MDEEQKNGQNQAFYIFRFPDISQSVHKIRLHREAAPQQEEIQINQDNHSRDKDTPAVHGKPRTFHPFLQNAHQQQPVMVLFQP